MQIFIVAVLTIIFGMISFYSANVKVPSLFICSVIGFLGIIINVWVKGSRLLDWISFCGVMGSLIAAAVIFFRIYF